MVRTILVGAGGALEVSHGPIVEFVDGMDLVAVVDANPEQLERARARLGVSATYTSLQECLQRESVDAAIIATPVHLHVEQAVACARHGVHVLLEKPMARTPTECRAIVQAHREAGTRLVVGFMKRHNRALLEATRLIESGAIGQVMGLRSSWDWGGNKSGLFEPLWRGQLKTWGGQWQDHGSHTVDLAQWWAGPVRSVYAVLDRTELFWEVENEYTVICTHESGARSLHQSTHHYHLPSQEHYLVCGDTGTLEISHPAGAGNWFENFRYDLLIHRYGREREDHTLPSDGNWLDSGRQYGQFKVELQHFIDCLRHDTAPLTDGEHGQQVLEVITAAYLSAQERREVDLPLTAEPDYERLFRSLPARIPPRQRPNPRSVPND